MTGDIVGLILAGGQARRLGGGDKPLRLLAGRPILSHVVERLAPQCARVLLNANGDPARFAAFGLDVVPDGDDRARGPLAGILAGIDHVEAHGLGRLVLSVSGDAPFLPLDLCTRLATARDAQGATLACARSGGRDHPTLTLWPVSIRNDLRRALDVESFHKVGGFLRRYTTAFVDFEGAVDPFFNINTPDDLARAEALA